MIHRLIMFTGLIILPQDAAVAPLLPSLIRRLHQAIAENHQDQVESLLALSADPNAVYLGATALQRAVIYKNPLIIRSLLQRGADLSDDIIERLLRTGNERYTIDGMLACLRILLVAGATTENIAVARGYLTPVMLAHGDGEAVHAIVIKEIRSHGKQKIS